MRGVLWLLLGRAHHDLEPHLVTDALLAGKRALALILEQPIYPAIQVGLLPAPHSRLGDVRLSLDRARAEALSRQQHDAGTLDDLLRRLAIGNEPLQPRPLNRPDIKACIHISHAALYTDLHNFGIL